MTTVVGEHIAVTPMVWQLHSFDDDLSTRNQVSYNLGTTLRIIDGLSFENTF